MPYCVALHFKFADVFYVEFPLFHAVSVWVVAITDMRKFLSVFCFLNGDMCC